MNILKYEYKAHKFIKLLFHFVFFILGFIFGLSINKVSAYSLGTINGQNINEEFIYNLYINKFPDFDINIYSNITCMLESDSTPYIECNAFDDIGLSLLNSKSYSFDTSRKRISFSDSTRIYNYRLYYDLKYHTYTSPFTNFSSQQSFYIFYEYYSGYSAISYSNFTLDAFGQYSSNINKLDFSQFTSLTFNPTLFDDDSNFKEVCVNSSDTFSITSKEISNYDADNQPQYSAFDFIWFKNGVTGISSYLYDTREENHIYNFTDLEYEFGGKHYWFNSRSNIDTYFNSVNPGGYLNRANYLNKYNYYNYTAYPFQMFFSNQYHFYTIFSFNNLKIFYPETEHGGGGAGHPFDDLENSDNDKICFYIKNIFDVNILNKNVFGDIYGDITVLEDITFNDQSYYNEFNSNVSGLINKVNIFFDYMRDTINFINSNIYNLYISMPLLVRLFILSFLTVFIIRLILGMVF